MSEHEQDLTRLERALAGLQPASARFDRDRLMFQAGGTVGRARRWLWPTATGVMTGIAACLAVIVAVRPDPAPNVHIVYVERPAADTPAKQESPLASPGAGSVREPVPPPALVAGHSYRELHELAMRHGVEAIPASMMSQSRAPSPVRNAPMSIGGWRSQPDPMFSLFNAGVE
jgi:hypothetical protein